MPALADVEAREHSRTEPARVACGNGAEIRVRIAHVRAPALLEARVMLTGVRGVLLVTDPSATSAANAGDADADVVILELARDDLSVPDAIRKLVRCVVSPVLVMSARPDIESIVSALDAGAAGVVPADTSREALIIAVRAIAGGQVVFPRCAMSALLNRARDDFATSREPPGQTKNGSHTGHDIARLTQRERTVFRMIAQGYSAPEVGARLFISKKTVETYKKRINDKLGLSHRTDYVRLALLSDVLATPGAARLE